MVQQIFLLPLYLQTSAYLAIYLFVVYELYRDVLGKIVLAVAIDVLNDLGRSLHTPTDLIHLVLRSWVFLNLAPVLTHHLNLAFICCRPFK